MPDVVVPAVVEPAPVLPVADTTPFDKVKALLYKIGEYLVDPRLTGVVVAVYMVLRMIGVVDAELDEAQLTENFHVLGKAAVALAEAVTVIAGLAKWLDGVTVRPPRGLTPWLEEIGRKRARDAAAKG